MDFGEIIIEEFNLRGIYPGVHYIDNTNYTMFKYANEDCPNARMLSNRLISLPLHLHLTDLDQNYIIEVVRELSENYERYYTFWRKGMTLSID